MKHELGIILSGGGARCVAHAGVLKTLTERGIYPGCVAGTSGGAIVGALYAAGHDPETILEFFLTRSPFRLSKLAFGKPGLIDSDKVIGDFRAYLPDDEFSSLTRELFVTATDIGNGLMEIFASGPLIRTVLASSSVPLVFSPVEIGDRLYCDGGLSNNFPAEPLQGLCRTVLGVYASPLKTVDRKELDNSLSISLRSLEVAMYSASKLKFRDCGVLICPPELAAYGAFGTNHFREIYAIGRKAAEARLAEIEKMM